MSKHASEKTSTIKNIQQYMTIDTCGSVGNITDATFFPCRKQKYLPKSLGIPALSLLDSKQKGSWPLKK